jgi:hypothetical protein
MSGHMPSMTLTEAATWAGKQRSTIFKAIKQGRISAKKDEKGHIQIDPAELERVFSPASVGNTENVSEYAAIERTDIAEKLATLQAENNLLRESLTDARLQRDKAMALAEAQTRLLTHQQEQKPKSRWRLFYRKSE